MLITTQQLHLTGLSVPAALKLTCNKLLPFIVNGAIIWCLPDELCVLLFRRAMMTLISRYPPRWCTSGVWWMVSWKLIWWRPCRNLEPSGNRDPKGLYVLLITTALFSVIVVLSQLFVCELCVWLCKGTGRHHWFGLPHGKLGLQALYCAFSLVQMLEHWKVYCMNEYTCAYVCVSSPVKCGKILEAWCCRTFVLTEITCNFSANKIFVRWKHNDQLIDQLTRRLQPYIFLMFI